MVIGAGGVSNCYLQSLSPRLRGTSYPGVHHIMTINPERVEPKMTLGAIDSDRVIPIQSTCRIF